MPNLSSYVNHHQMMNTLINLIQPVSLPKYFILLFFCCLIMTLYTWRGKNNQSIYKFIFLLLISIKLCYTILYRVNISTMLIPFFRIVMYFFKARRISVFLVHSAMQNKTSYIDCGSETLASGRSFLIQEKRAYACQPRVVGSQSR